MSLKLEVLICIFPYQLPILRIILEMTRRRIMDLRRVIKTWNNCKKAI